MKFDNVIILAAGKGSRFHELGKVYPKCCLPYKGKPIIVHLVEQASKYTDFITITYMEESQKVSIQENINLYPGLIERVEFRQVVERSHFGPAISLGSSLEEDNTLVLLSDYYVDLERVLQEPTPHRNQVYVMQVEGDYSRWCMVDQEGNFIDKPKHDPNTNLAVSGIYYISSHSEYNDKLDQVKSDNDDSEIQFSEVFSLMESGFEFNVIDSDEIVDMGTLPEYLANKGVRKERSFNTIELLEEPNNTKLIKKSSTDYSSLMKESTFILHSPKQIKNYFPKIHEINPEESYYLMDYVPNNNLRELFLFLDKSYSTWLKVFISTKEFITTCSETHKNESSCFWKKTTAKNIERINDDYFNSKGKNNLIEWVYSLEKELVKEFGETNTLFHGDLHFANMFFDFSLDRLMLVDPRGDFSGHWFYDLAKLYHSVIGRYDFIDLELYSLGENKVLFYDNGLEEVRRAFYDVFGDLIEGRRVLLEKLTASLFLSMIPLHKHNKENMDLFYFEFERLNNL